jgi:tRNA(fMet)-specific endonuclease VapC
MREEPAMLSFLAAGRPGEFALVPPVVAEIEYGIQRLPAGTQKRLLLERQRARYLPRFRWLDWTPSASEEFGRIKAVLEAAGTPIDDFDIAVAAIALAHDAAVVTANIVHFSRVPDLTVEHW